VRVRQRRPPEETEHLFDLNLLATHRDVIEAEGSYALREPTEAYAGKFTGGIEALRTQNTMVWNKSVDDART
jgi:hypothetical protein